MMEFGIIVSDHIQPLPRPALTVSIAVQQSVHQMLPCIRTLIRHIEALRYEVFTLSWDIGWIEIPQEDWSIVVTIFLGDINDSRQLLLIVPLPCRCRRLTRSGAILGSYNDKGSSLGW